MRFIIQRVTQAQVTVGEQVVGCIGEGLLVLVGISHTDDPQIADKMIKKLIALRIFEDEDGKTNLDIKATHGQLLIISQFTLYANCRKGNRPAFTDAGPPSMAKALYEYILSQCASEVPIVQSGQFGADMQVALVNDGPFTILLDSDHIT